MQHSAHKNSSDHADEQRLPASFSHGNSTAPDFVQTEKGIIQVTEVPGYVLPLLSENNERTEGALCVTSVECELHTNVHSLNNTYGNQQVLRHGRHMKSLTF